MAKFGSYLFITFVAILMILGIAFKDWPPNANATTVTFDTYTSGSVITHTILNTNILARIKTAIDALNTTDSAKLSSTTFTQYTSNSRLMRSVFNTYTGDNRLPYSVFNSYTGNDRTMQSVFTGYTSKIRTKNTVFNPFTTSISARNALKLATATFNPYTTNAASRFYTKPVFNAYSSREVTRNGLKANAASPALTGSGTFANMSGSGYIMIQNGYLVTRGTDGVRYRIKATGAGFGKISTVAY